jgi:hypothetical protein
MQSRERRAFPRHPAQGRATIHHPGTSRAAASGELFDISAGGVCIMLRDPPEVAEQVSLELQNPAQRVSVRVAGEVAHVTPHKSGWYRVGCAFQDGSLDICSW